MKTPLDISEILENFGKENDLMKSTRIQYYNVMRLFFKWVEVNGYDWRELGISHLINFKDSLFDENRTTRTIRYYLIVIKIFFKWLENNGTYTNIAEGIKLPKIQKTFSKKALTPDQAKQLLDSIDRTTILGKRDYALFSLLFITGLRSISVESINIGDLKDYAGQTVIYYLNKGSRQKDHFKPITPNCLDSIEAYLLAREGFSDNWPLFATHSVSRKGQRLTRQSMRKIFKKRLKDIGINDDLISLHSTRHTHGIISIKAVGAYETQLSLNHISAQTTRIYSNGADVEIIMNNRAGKAVDSLLL